MESSKNVKTGKGLGTENLSTIVSKIVNMSSIEILHLLEDTEDMDAKQQIVDLWALYSHKSNKVREIQASSSIQSEKSGNSQLGGNF